MNTTAQQDRITIVKPTQSLVASQIETFRAELNGLVQQGAIHLAIDLAGVEMIDSKGLAVFMQCHKTVAARGGSLTVLTASPDYQFMFHAMRLDEHFSVREVL